MTAMLVHLNALGKATFEVVLDTAFAAGNRAGAGYVQTSAVTATPSGLPDSDVYLWTRVGGDTDVNIVNANIATTAFFVSSIPADESRSADFVCTVTRAGVSVQSQPVTAVLTAL